ncbi:MAG: F0F1 ATP synthase subunit B, partial [Bacteroidales bacterium]|nr:F0F1 ATP synthase subunit B [Bacteroidales bacterium]
ILWKFGWPVVIDMMSKREEQIKKSLEEAAIAREEMKQLQVGNERLLIEAQKERDLMLQQTKELKEKMIEEAKEQAQKEAQRIVVAARENIEYEKLHAMTELKNQIANLSIEIAEDLLKHELSDKVKSNEIISKRMSEINLK